MPGRCLCSTVPHGTYSLRVVAVRFAAAVRPPTSIELPPLVCLPHNLMYGGSRFKRAYLVFHSRHDGSNYTFQGQNAHKAEISHALHTLGLDRIKLRSIMQKTEIE